MLNFIQTVNQKVDFNLYKVSAFQITSRKDTKTKKEVHRVEVIMDNGAVYGIQEYDEFDKAVTAKLQLVRQLLGVKQETTKTTLIQKLFRRG